jgi:hypothetical protein
VTLRSQPVELDRDEFWQRRECTRRDCGNNLRRKINPRDYDSCMGFLCDQCQDEEDERDRMPRRNRDEVQD